MTEKACALKCVILVQRNVKARVLLRALVYCVLRIPLRITRAFANWDQNVGFPQDQACGSTCF